MQPARQVRLRDHPVLLAGLQGFGWYQSHADTNAMRRPKTVGRLEGVTKRGWERLEASARWCLSPSLEQPVIWSPKRRALWVLIWMGLVQAPVPEVGRIPTAAFRAISVLAAPATPAPPEPRPQPANAKHSDADERQATHVGAGLMFEN